MGEIDPAFIQDPEQRPKLFTVQSEEIPVIDLSPITNLTVSDPSAIEGVVKEVGDACKEWGFFQVINHGVPFTLRERVIEATKMFFAQSREEKRKVRRDEFSISGYFDTEHTKNLRDWKEVYDFLANAPTSVPATCDAHDDRVTQWTNRIPEYPPNFRGILEEYIEQVRKLSFKLMELIALSLGLEAKRFEEYFINGDTTMLRTNYYPPCPCPHLALGVGPHKDSGCLTILTEDKGGGLQVKRKSDHEWISVKIIPDSYVVNVGDIIQVWTNDAYMSVEHRAICNTEEERFSYPYFFYPKHDTEVKPLEELINEKNPPKYRPYNWGKFLVERSYTNFENRKMVNVQIDHFKIA